MHLMMSSTEGRLDASYDEQHGREALSRSQRRDRHLAHGKNSGLGVRWEEEGWWWWWWRGWRALARRNGGDGMVVVSTKREQGWFGGGKQRGVEKQ